MAKRIASCARSSPIDPGRHTVTRSRSSSRDALGNGRRTASPPRRGSGASPRVMRIGDVATGEDRCELVEMGAGAVGALDFAAESGSRFPRRSLHWTGADQFCGERDSITGLACGGAQRGHAVAGGRTDIAPIADLVVANIGIHGNDDPQVGRAIHGFYRQALRQQMPVRLARKALKAEADDAAPRGAKGYLALQGRSLQVECPMITKHSVAFGLEEVARIILHAERCTVDADAERQPVRAH